MIPQSTRDGIATYPLTDLRHTIENFQLSNGSTQPSETAPHPRRYSRIFPPKVTNPEVRIYHHHGDVGDPGVELNVGNASETFDRKQNSLLVSSHTSQANVRYLGQSSHQDKAKQVMGLNGKKSLSSVQRKRIQDDGNIAALETKVLDIITPRTETFEGSPKIDIVKETRGSIEEDRIKETAREIYNGNELSVSFGDAAKWLTNNNDFNSKVRTAYMGLFDFMGLDILTAVRYV